MDIKTKQEQAKAAIAMARTYELLYHRSQFYIPAQYQTRAYGSCPVDEMVWLPLTDDKIREWANGRFDILFDSDSEITSFRLKLKQLALAQNPPGAGDDAQITSLMLHTEDGLRVLNDEGELVEPDGLFRPNYIETPLNTDPVVKAELLEVIVNWVGSEESAHSLLYHLATILSPGYSAVKYVLLMGGGRNGKSLLLKMLTALFGEGNASQVTRQDMASSSSVCGALNGKLLNVVFDGTMEYIKDSAMEKTLIAGEPGQVRMLWQSGYTRIQTNGLFIEGLNQEPKTRDKSSALQKRLVRFGFNQVFAVDKAFERKMLSAEMLGALLSLMVDHFVKDHELDEKLALVGDSIELQVEQTLINSPLQQYLMYLVDSEPSKLVELESRTLQVEPLVGSFNAWQIRELKSTYTDVEVRRLFRDGFGLYPKNTMVNGKRTKRMFLGDPKPDVRALLDSLKAREEVEDDGSETVVADGQLPEQQDGGRPRPNGYVHLGAEGSGLGEALAERQD